MANCLSRRAEDDCGTLSALAAAWAPMMTESRAGGVTNHAAYVVDDEIDFMDVELVQARENHCDTPVNFSLDESTPHTPGILRPSSATQASPLICVPVRAHPARGRSQPPIKR